MAIDESRVNPEAPTVKIVEDGFTLLIDDFSIDEERYHFRVRATWDGLAESLVDSGNPTRFPAFSIDVKGLRTMRGAQEPPHTGFWVPRKPNEHIEFEEESNALEPGELRRFLATGPGCLTVSVKIVERRISGSDLPESEIVRDLHDFGEVRIPFDASRIPRSRIYPLTVGARLRCGELGEVQFTLRRLLISPSVTIVEYDTEASRGGLWIDRFKGVFLSDEKGNILRSRHESYGYSYYDRGEAGAWAIHFVPTLYRAPTPRKLVFGFEGIVLHDSTAKLPDITLRLDDEFPKRVSHAGMELLITGARYAGDLLHLDTSTPRDNRGGGMVYHARLSVKDDRYTGKAKGFARMPGCEPVKAIAVPCNQRDEYVLEVSGLSCLFRTETRVEAELSSP